MFQLQKKKLKEKLKDILALPTQALSYYIGRQIFKNGFKDFEKKIKKLIINILKKIYIKNIII